MSNGEVKGTLLLPEVKDEDFVAIANADLGWQAAIEGRIGPARIAYGVADSLMTRGSMNPELSLLRHSQGVVSEPALMAGHPASEDQVLTIYLPEFVESEEPNDAFAPMKISGMQDNIRAFMGGFDPGLHRHNITKQLPHVMVMSTGRCGTMSLFRLFKDCNLVPYHSYWWQIGMAAKWEAMCRLSANKHSNIPFRDWCATRAAEWLGCISMNRPMIGLNHWDTIFAPAFAALHTESKFVYLHRDPVAIFNSFYNKKQYLPDNQLRPLDYTLDPDFRFSKPPLGIIQLTAWYIRFTEVFCREFGAVMGDRFMEVRAESLFEQDMDAIEGLLDFVAANVSPAEAHHHFATRINAKDHKKRFNEQEMEEGRAEFAQAYEQFSHD